MILPRRFERDSAERWRSSLWMWPVVGAAVAVPIALLLSRVRPARGTALAHLWFGDYSSATSVLQAMATAVMTATTLTFSVTVIALQLASQQFSPRLLREFGRDPVTKAVLVVLSVSFVFTTATLYALREDERLPTLSVLLGFLLGVASLIAILAFITHIVKLIRVDTVMLVVHDETTEAISRFYPPYGDEAVRSPQELELDDRDGTSIASEESGFLRMTDVGRLLETANRRDLVIRVEIRAGDHVVHGAPIATVFPAPSEDDLAALADEIHAALAFGYERTIEQDAGFGIRQLEDIAIKAVSPAINDPVTAAHAVGHMAAILSRLVGCRLGATLHEDDAGVARVIVPDRDLRYYLDLACGQLRRFAKDEPGVLVALMRMLRDVATACRDDDQREEVRAAAELVARQLSPDVLDDDAALLHALHARVLLALQRDTRNAYADRVGETRSM